MLNPLDVSLKRTWRRTKNPLNKSWLHRQIARCNSLVNKDKSNYYSKLISDNSQDPRKLWYVLQKNLGRVSDMTLPPHDSDKALANQFASYFHNKIKTIRDTFISSGIEMDVHPSCDPPKLLPLLKLLKILSIKSSETRLRNPACWTPGLLFSSKSVVTYYCHQ